MDQSTSSSKVDQNATKDDDGRKNNSELIDNGADGADAERQKSEGTVPPKSEEEMKAEALEQLKKIGNICLQPFGLGVDDFQMIPQPGGGYTVQMKQKGKDEQKK